jgi:hypothetical protein
MARSSRFALSILSLAVLALVLCATPIDAQRGQVRMPYTALHVCICSRPHVLWTFFGFSKLISAGAKLHMAVLNSPCGLFLELRGITLL